MAGSPIVDNYAIAIALSSPDNTEQWIFPVAFPVPVAVGCDFESARVEVHRGKAMEVHTGRAERSRYAVSRIRVSSELCIGPPVLQGEETGVCGSA
jgi:hypothetical protein